MSYWEELERPAPDSVEVGGVALRRRSRVRLRPHAGGDVFDLVLAGRTAVVEGIDQDMEGNLRLAVVVEDDPGRDLGERRQPGHRFFFSPEEVEPLGDEAPATGVRVLVAGIGNVFLGDDGFGVALADRLARRELPPGSRWWTTASAAWTSPTRCRTATTPRSCSTPSRAASRRGRCS